MNKISQANLLNAVFQNVYGRNFDAKNIEDRVMLQKAVFLMRECGISCGEYEFVWDQYGPFSAELSDDMKVETENSSVEVKFNQDAKNIMGHLKNVFAQDTQYNVRYWAEAIASILYLKQYMYPSYTDDEILRTLEERKEKLRNHQENLKAMKATQTIMAM